MAGKKYTEDFDLSYLSAGDVHIGTSNEFIDNSGRTIEPEAGEKQEYTDLCLIGVSNTVIDYSNTNISVKSSGGKKITGTKVIGSQNVQVIADCAEQSVEATNLNSEATGFDVERTENFHANLSNGSLRIQSTDGAKATYMRNGEMTAENCKITVVADD